MRFHIGFSKRISKKTIIFILGLISIALAMFFGNTEIALAEQVTTRPGYVAYYRDNSASPITPTLECNSYNCYYFVSNVGGFNGYNFTSSYDLKSYSCSSRKADVTIGFWLYNNGSLISDRLNLSNTGGNGSASVVSNDPGTAYFKFSNVNLDNYLTFVVNASGGNSTTVTQYLTSAAITIDCIPDGVASLIDNQNQNTQTIVDSFTQNTQDIIDNQNSDNVSTANSNASSFFNNFHINDTRGLTSVITAPIRLLQGIVNSNDSCDPYTFTIQILGTESKTVSLPSGCILWNNVPSLVIISYWVIVWAIVGYRCLVDMIHFTSALRDPDHKNDYTLDL